MKYCINILCTITGTLETNQSPIKQITFFQVLHCCKKWKFQIFAWDKLSTSTVVNSIQKAKTSTESLQATVAAEDNELQLHSTSCSTRSF